VTGKYQPNPSPAFNTPRGERLAVTSSQPQVFTAIDFSIATNKPGPPEGQSVPAPKIIDTNGKLSGQVEAWSAPGTSCTSTRGRPSPDGSHPGLTKPLTGTYNAKTHAFLDHLDEPGGGRAVQRVHRVLAPDGHFRRQIEPIAQSSEKRVSW
jgi:hypothetical protein